MTTMQKKTLAHLESLAQNRQLDFVVDTDFANTGVIRYQEGFRTLATITFKFQTNYAEFELFPGGDNRRHPITRGGQKHHVQHGNVEDWSRLWQAVVEHIGPEKKEG